MARNWAICIGVNEYHNFDSLSFAVRDAEQMRDWFVGEAGFGQNDVYLFTDNSPPIADAGKPYPSQPTYATLIRFLDNRFENKFLSAGDNLWFFFSGHGLRHGDRDYLMLSDSSASGQLIEKTAIPVNYVTERLRRCGADNVVIIQDACRNQGAKGIGIGEEKQAGVITFASCSPAEKSYEIETLQHGAFTYALLESLRLQGEGNCATVERLYNRLRYRVAEINQLHRKPRQTPYAIVEPATKYHLILLPKQATLHDINALKMDAQEAEIEKDFSLAEQPWTRILAVSPADNQALKALRRIWQQPQGNPAPQPTPLPTASVTAKGQEDEREPERLESFTENLGNGVSLEMVAIPAGSFMMGAPETEKDSRDSERPQHRVSVPAFLMGKYPITQKQWRIVAAMPKIERELNPDPSKFKGDNLPVENVSWLDVAEFCKRLSAHTGREYRLPSEAEWEYGCRAGTATAYYFGNDASKLGDYAWYGEGLEGKTHPVGEKLPNGFGLYDMHGNVWEWCEDDWHSNYTGAPTDGRAWVGDNDNRSRFGKLLRGGSWFNNARNCRAGDRDWIKADYHNLSFGFRVACRSFLPSTC